MSGHSKWSTIKHKKAAQDAKRGSVFTKLSNMISVAAKQAGPDPNSNLTLRLAIDKARSANMPKDNIKKAIQRGTCELAGENIEEALYEAILPGHTAIIIKVVTDNKNRALTEIKTILTKNNGQLVSKNSLLWQFEQKGVITLNQNNLAGPNQDETELQLIDLGAEDIKWEDEYVFIYTQANQLQHAKNNLNSHNYLVESAEIEFIAKEKKEIDQETRNKLEKIFELLDDLPDVSDFYTNLK